MKTVSVALVVVIGIYALVVADTNQLMNEARAVFMLQVPFEQTQGTPLHIYNDSNRSSIRNGNDIKVFLSITRLFVIHNFTDGYMWLIYTYQINDGDEVITGSWNVITKWTIHKTGGRWEVVQIDESP